MEIREAEGEERTTARPVVRNGHSREDGDATAAIRRGPPRRVMFGAIGAVIAIVLLIWGVKWFLYSSNHEGTDDARVDADVVAVTSKIGEKIERILVDTNDPVRANQLLIVMNDSDEQARLAQAQAQYDLAIANQHATTLQDQGSVTQAQANVVSARTQVPLSQAGVEQAIAQLAAAQAQLPAAQATFAQAQAEYTRVRSLVATG